MAFDWFPEKFSNLFSWLGAFLHPMVHQILVGGGQLLATAALEAVAAVEADPSIVGSATKSAAAFGKIAAELEVIGIPVIAQAINAAIEAAVAKIAPAVPPPPPAP